MNLEFKYKGDREYVHGTSIYNELINHLTSTEKINFLTNIDLKFHSIVKNNLSLVKLSEESIEDTIPKVTLRFSHLNETFKYCLIENSIPVKDRIACPEKEIIKNTELDLDGKKISLNQRLNYSTIEVIVAMNKSLHYDVFRGQIGKWYFARISLIENLPSNYHSINLSLVNEKNTRLTKSDILIDNHKIGSIFFSLKN